MCVDTYGGQSPSQVCSLIALHRIFELGSPTHPGAQGLGILAGQ